MKRFKIFFSLVFICLNMILWSQESSSTLNELIIDEVKIGNQIWMQKNLDVVTFRNGDTIPQVFGEKEWEVAGFEERPAWCYYNNDSINGFKYGKLYNWYAVNDPRGLAPDGWEIPTYDDWVMLKKEIKKIPDTTAKYSCCKIKEISHWKLIDETLTKRKQRKYPNCLNVTNSSGFSARPAGERSSLGFDQIGEIGCLWTMTSTSFHSADYVRIVDMCTINNILIFSRNKNDGLSVRCFKVME